LAKAANLLTLSIAILLSGAPARAQLVEPAMPSNANFYDALEACWAALANDPLDQSALQTRGWKIGRPNEVDLRINATRFERDDSSITLHTFGIQCSASGRVVNLEAAKSIIAFVTDRASTQFAQNFTSYTAEGRRVLKLSDGREAMLSIQKQTNGLKVVIDAQKPKS
jgi:hypothetical protein